MLSPPTNPIYVGDKKPAPKKVDILFSQGMRDTLFNFNEAWGNYQAYKALGGDVRLMTHESGHILPGTQTLIGALGPLNMLTDPLLGGLNSVGLAVPDLQRPGGRNNCGALSRDDADLAFLNDKLNPPQKEAADLVTKTALAQLKTKVCLSLNDGSDGSMGESVFVSPESITATRAKTKIPTSIIPVPNTALGLTSLLVPSFIPLEGFKAPLTIGGIGQLDIKLNNVLEPLNGCDLPLGLPAQLTDNIPAPLSGLLGLLPTQLPIRACDAIVLVGFGAKKGMAAPRLIDEQMQPIRGLGSHKVSMVGVAEKLTDGEQLGLMVYGYNLQYLTSLSRDLLVPAVTISGTVEVPQLINSL
jgi:ABC-2 type transport system ATP-binding protein